MAAGRHNPTRRALLGAAIGAPALLAGGRAAAAAGQAEAARLGVRWARALGRYRQAEAALSAFQRTYPEPPADVPFMIHKALDDRFGDLLCAQNAALCRLAATPVPDLAALALKIELAVDQELATLIGGERGMEALKADAWRLIGGPGAAEVED